MSADVLYLVHAQVTCSNTVYALGFSTSAASNAPILLPPAAYNNTRLVPPAIPTRLDRHQRHGLGIPSTLQQNTIAVNGLSILHIGGQVHKLNSLLDPSIYLFDHFCFSWVVEA
jgi:hypothetical protein